MITIARGETFETRALALGDRSRGFDYLRVVLAVSVVAWHSWGLVFGRESIQQALSSPAGTLITAILPAFFALSGYLVTMSLYRSTTIRKYIMLRVIRLVPALSVEIVLSAFILGPLVTTLAMIAYFSDTIFLKYFLNLLGVVQYRLPGVFEGNPYPDVVNGSLWTLPYELECYVYLVALSTFGALRRRSVFLLGLCIAIVFVMFVPYFERGSILLVLKQLVSSASSVDPNLQADARAIAANPAHMVVIAFLSGAAIFAFRDSLLFDWRLMLMCVLVTFILLSSPIYHLAALPIAYITVWIGLLNPPSTWVVSKGDYSYGIYLYSFPMQQVVSMFFSPEIGYFGHFAVSLGLTSLLAILSWHLIEKPFQKVKRYFR